MNKLKTKILKINSSSILILISLFAIMTFGSVYFLLDKFYHQDISFIKHEYLSSQKAIIKNQVNNFINFIEHTRKIVKTHELEEVRSTVKTLAKIFSVSNPKEFILLIKNVQEKNKEMKFGLTDINGNLIFSTSKDYKKIRRVNAIKYGFNRLNTIETEIGKKYFYLVKFKNRFNNKTYVIGGAIYQKTIENIVKKIVLDRVNSIKFGAKNNGYISIGEILNYDGGKGFAKVLALPIKPSWIGKLLDDDKKDAKGKLYRKEYLKIINTIGEGYVSYWFFKKGTKQLRPKLSYVKLYKPYNWMIFTGVYMDDINNIIQMKEKRIKKEIKQIFFVYVLFSIIFLLIAYLITKYENKVLDKIIDSYEKIIKIKNQELREINKNLEKEVEEKTQKLLDTLLKDNLTKLPNREKLLLDMTNTQCVAILNIDSFKEINDFYGLEVGDEVLQKVAVILQDLVNKDIYKLPADEFAILGDSIEELEEKIKHILSVFSTISLRLNNKLTLNISITTGIGKSIIEADMALKYAKKHKIKLLVFNENLNILKEYENNIKWREIISKAIKKDNILPFLKPIIDNKTQKVNKYECLVRLKDGDKIYSPFFFLEISKQTNQYYDIQKIMVEKTFEKFKDLDYKFSINLSTLDLTNYAFKEFLVQKIEEYNIADKLIIELLEDEELLQKDILEFLNSLKKKGIQISIDDFGSGYSNFSYLIKDVPLDILKVDGSLVKNIAESKKDYQLLKVIVNMAHEFGFKIVAEFVENEEIFKLLKELNVDYSQGYYFSAPFDMRELKS